MFALVEPLMTYGLTDRPNLGCAILIAACQGDGIPVTLIPGETRRIREIFLHDADALFDLVGEVRDDMTHYKTLPMFRREVLAMGREAFREELRSLYQAVVVDKRLRDYLNPALVGRFQYVYRQSFETYAHHIKVLRNEDLDVVHRYVRDILACGPEAAGFSVYHRFDPLTRAVRKALKKKSGIPIIVGGSITPHIQGEKRLRALREEAMDYLVEGHAERVLAPLIKEIRHNPDPKIPNVFYLRGDAMVSNPVELPGDLNSLPIPDFSQFDLDAYLSPRLILPTLTARGCSWRECTFCAHYAIDQDTYKTYRVDRIIQTLEEYRDKYGCRHVAFHDEEIPPARVKALCQALIDRGLTDFRFNLYSKMHPDYQDETLADLMHRAGFRMAHWGLESASQPVLDRMKKGADVGSMERILQVQSRHGMANCCFIIFGFPGETREDAQRTVDFLVRNREAIDIAAASSFLLGPGTPIGQNPEAFGVIPLPDGKFRMAEGMQPEEVNAFREDLEARGVRLQSDRYFCLVPDTTSRMMIFLLACQGARRKPEVTPDGYPLLLGRLTPSEDGGARLSRIDVTASALENGRLSREEETLDAWTSALAHLADGAHRVDEIAEALNAPPARVMEQLQAWALQHRMLVFSERWQDAACDLSLSSS